MSLAPPTVVPLLAAAIRGSLHPIIGHHETHQTHEIDPGWTFAPFNPLARQCLFSVVGRRACTRSGSRCKCGFLSSDLARRSAYEKGAALAKEERRDDLFPVGGALAAPRSSPTTTRLNSRNQKPRQVSQRTRRADTEAGGEYRPSARSVSALSALNSDILLRRDPRDPTIYDASIRFGSRSSTSN